MRIKHVSIAVIALLTIVGCSTQPPQADQPSSSATSSPTPTTSTPVPPMRMPDLVGQPYSSAFNVLAGYNVRITKRSKISPQQEGMVIEQDPVGGADFAQQVTLTVSVAPPVVPNVVGQTFDTAEQSLTGLGFSVRTVPDFDDPRADGLVVAQDPSKGTKNAAEVMLSVVRRPVQVYLADTQQVALEGTNTFATTAEKANGKNYSHSVIMSSYESSSASVEYDLSREYRRLIGAIAMANDASSNAEYRVEIFGDGRQLYADNVGFGVTKQLKADVTKVLRLKIVVTDLAGSKDDSDSRLVFGDIRLQGLQSEVSASPTISSTP